MATYDLNYPGAAIDAILDTAYDLQNAGYIFRGLASEYRKIAKMYGCEFIDLGEVAKTADYEGVHLDAEGHKAVAEAYAAKIREIFE